jgi:hypothetical protein
LLIALAGSGAAASAQSGAVLLQLRPHAGDTLRLRLDQTIEITRTPRGASPGRPDVASLIIQARLAVASVDQDGADVVALTDSVRISASQSYASSGVLRGARALQGKHLRFRVAPDGSTTLAGAGAWSASSAGSLFLQLPATLPLDAQVPGATWTRAVVIPLAATPDGQASAQLNATFTFDSLSRSGEHVYLSVQGRLLRSGPIQGAGSRFVHTTGEVSGKILIDRRRGWISDARTVVTLEAQITGEQSSATRARVKITQWMRVL